MLVKIVAPVQLKKVHADLVHPEHLLANHIRVGGGIAAEQRNSLRAMSTVNVGIVGGEPGVGCAPIRCKLGLRSARTGAACTTTSDKIR